MQEPTNAPSDNKQCFNCGKDLETHTTFCPHCGAPLPTEGSGFVMVSRFIALLILGGMSLLCGAAGACFMVVAATGGAALDLGGPSASVAAFAGVICILASATCGWGLVLLRKRRK